jgi:hypothetical protein
MGMLERAQADIKRISGDSTGFTEQLTFTTPDGLTTAVIYGIPNKIHLGINTEGEQMNSRKSSVSISESNLTDLGYPTRDADNICSLKNHKVTLIDSTGLAAQYIIREVFPDESVGMIVCMLGSYE